MAYNPVGTEVIQVLPVAAGANPPYAFAAQTQQVTLQQIAQLTGGTGFSGTFVATGQTAVTVANVNTSITKIIDFSLNTVGGTVGAYPVINTITAGVGFTVLTSLGDTSTYNYAIQ